MEPSEFSVSEGWVGSIALGIHADEVPDFPDCGRVGYYGPGGFTTRRGDASFEIGGNGGADIEIRLPASPYELCRGQTLVAGTVLGPDGEPVDGIGRARGGVSHAYAHSNGHADTGTHVYADSHPDLDDRAHAHSNGHAHTGTHVYADSHPDVDARAHGHTDAHTHRDLSGSCGADASDIYRRDCAALGDCPYFG